MCVLENGVKLWRFKPYKGVSSNVRGVLEDKIDAVSNPIREYLQIDEEKVKEVIEALFQTL